jgi:hypothetical protein
MKDLIKSALDSLYASLKANAPTTGRATKSISILDVDPLDLPNFMRDNNIPDTAFFDGEDNGYDGWDDILLSWEVTVPLSDTAIEHGIRNSFNLRAFKPVFDILISNGYTRISSGSHMYRDFKNTTVYDMYRAGDWDRLVDYYSLSFTLKNN